MHCIGKCRGKKHAIRQCTTYYQLTIPGRGVAVLDILFSSNHNIHKSLYGLCFWASDPLIDKYFYDLSIKGSEAQK